MTRRFFTGLILLTVAALGRADDESFSKSILPDDFNAAGLSRLSPAELKRLDELVKAYKSADIAAARRSAADALTAKRAAEAEAKAAKAESKAAKAEAAESKKNSQGFFAKAKVLLVPGTKIEYAEIKTTIVGKFEGWESQTVFVLANGQRWQVANSGDNYFTPPKDNIEVEIRPSPIGGFWMFFPSLNAQVRVKLVEK